MSKEKIIRRGDPCNSRVKGNKCGHYSLLLSPRDLSLIPTGVRETKRGGRQCGLTMMYSSLEECVIPGDGKEFTSKGLLWDGEAKDLNGGDDL